MFRCLYVCWTIYKSMFQFKVKQSPSHWLLNSEMDNQCGAGLFQLLMRLLCWRGGMGCGNNWTLGWVDGSDSDFYITAKKTENRLVVFGTTAWILVTHVNSVIFVSLLGRWKKNLRSLFQWIDLDQSEVLETVQSQLIQQLPCKQFKTAPSEWNMLEVFYPNKQICEFEYTSSTYVGFYFCTSSQRVLGETVLGAVFALSPHALLKHFHRFVL